MANVTDAVIELGSSDEDTPPAPKKLKLKSNAMVHIPANLDNLTIKPVRPKQTGLNNLSKLNKIQVTKVSNVPAQVKMQVKKSNVPFNIPIHHTQRKPVQGLIFNSMSINPVNIASKLNKPQLPVNRVNSKGQLKRPISLKNCNTLNLPPSITVTKTYPKSNVVKRKQQIVNKKPVSTVMPTVDIADDEEPTGSASGGPQWYLRPEQESPATISKPEEVNNKEPVTNLVEITIEDSPVKRSKMGCFEIGVEYPITIEDSPLKPPTNDSNKSSDEETSGGKVGNSKKMLKYPETETAVNTEVVEIELEPLEAHNNSDISSPELNKDVTKGNVEISVTKSEHLESNNSTKDSEKNSPVTKDNTPRESDFGADTTFNSTYQTFINLCLKLEDTDDMKKIVEKKIKGYYTQVPREFTESEEFNDIVLSKIDSMKACPDKMYLYIKDVVDELNAQRKLAKSKPPENEEKDIETQKFLYGENSEFDHKRQRQIRKLEKTLKKLHRVIKKLEEQEVDFDDEEDSVYLLTESDDGSSTSDYDNELERYKNELLKRYKERMVRVHAKLCQLTNTKMPSEPHVYIAARPGHNPGPAKKLEKWVNRKIPIGAPLPFPDFHDVLQCVREANEEDKLGWSEAFMKEEAQDLFARCGKILQRRRQENEWRLAVTRISSDLDPADESEELKKQLDENRKLAAKREAEILNKFADRQKQLKLEAEEIGDKEANESPRDEDDEDDIMYEASTSSCKKLKRKNKLKELTYEKGNKTKSLNRVKDDKISDSAGSVESLIHSESTGAKPENNEQADNKKDNEEIDLLSSDDKVASDIDELHLLQELKSGITGFSSTYESQSDVVISDTTESDNCVSNKVTMSDDVISIENSSYSESDTNIVLKDPLLSDNVQEIESKSENEFSNTNQENENEKAHIDPNKQDLLIALSDDESSNEQKSLNKECCNLNDAKTAKAKIINDSSLSVIKEKENESVTLKDKDALTKRDVCVKSGMNDTDNIIYNVDANKLERNEVVNTSKLNNNDNEDVVMTEQHDDVITVSNNDDDDCYNFDTNSVDVIMSEVNEKNNDIQNCDTVENQDIPKIKDHDENNKIGSPSINKSGNDYSENENMDVDLTLGTSLNDKEDVLTAKEATDNLEKSLEINENNETTSCSQLITENSKDLDISGYDKNFDIETDSVEEKINEIIGIGNVGEIHSQDSIAKAKDDGDIISVENGDLFSDKALVEKVTNSDSIASINCEIVLKEKDSKGSKECSKKDVEEDELKKVENILEKMFNTDL